MKLSDKVAWMEEWCAKEGLKLYLEGEVGFGRECVGVGTIEDGTYPDYVWYDDDYENRIDNNGDVMIPKLAYHKHPCVAVLGRGGESIRQLYEWLKWFSDNDFHYKCIKIEGNAYDELDEIELMLGRDYNHRMVKGV